MATIVRIPKTTTSSSWLGDAAISRMGQLADAPRRPESAPTGPLLTLEDVAGWLQVSKAWVRDHATRRSPRIPCVRLGGRRAVLRFRREDVEQFIHANVSSGGV